MFNLNSSQSQEPSESIPAEQTVTSPGHTPERPPQKNETISSQACGCSCSCQRCTCGCRLEPSRDALDIPRNTRNLESRSLVTEFSGLTFGDSAESEGSFDREMGPHEERRQPSQLTENSQHNEGGEDEDIELDPLNEFLDRRPSGDSNQDDAGEPFEPLMFPTDMSDSMNVNTGDEDLLMQSYVASLSPSSSGSSALIKDAGAMFDSI